MKTEEKAILKLKKAIWNKSTTGKHDSGDFEGAGGSSRLSLRKSNSAYICSRCGLIVVPLSSSCSNCHRFLNSSRGVEPVARTRPFDVSLMSQGVKMEIDKCLQTGEFLTYLKAVLENIPGYVQQSILLDLPDSEASRSILSTISYADLFTHLKALRVEHIQRWMRPVVQKLMFHPKNSNFFNRPVDPDALGVPEYHLVVRTPMDLGTVRSRLQRGLYESVAAVKTDVALVFNNATAFNPPSNLVYQHAQILKSEFESEMVSLQERCARDVEKKLAHSCSLCMGASCSLCGEKCLKFEPPVLVCHGPCGQRIKKNALYFVTVDGILVWCQKCFGNLPSTVMEFTSRPPLMKRDILRRKSDEEVAEPWVNCDCCGQWVHQICALYSDRCADDATVLDCSPSGSGRGRRNSSKRGMAQESAGYHCPLCKLETVASASMVCDISPTIVSSSRGKRLVSNSTSPTQTRKRKGRGLNELIISNSLSVVGDDPVKLGCDQDVIVEVVEDMAPYDIPSKGEEGSFSLSVAAESGSTPMITVGGDESDAENEDFANSPITSTGSVASFSSNGSSEVRFEQFSDREIDGVDDDELEQPMVESSRTSPGGDEPSTFVVDGPPGRLTIAESLAVYEDDDSTSSIVDSVNMNEDQDAGDEVSHHMGDDGTSTCASVLDISEAKCDSDCVDINFIDSDYKSKMVVDEPVVASAPVDSMGMHHSLNIPSKTAKVSFRPNPSPIPPSPLSPPDSPGQTRTTPPRSRKLWSAAELPTSKLSNFVEAMVAERLKKCGFADAASSISIRMTSNASHSLDVPDPLQANMMTTSGTFVPKSVPYKQKCLLLFQKTDGVDICLFCLYVQEFDAQCPAPNTNVVYIAYIDSIDYFRPMEARTLVYHEILVAYLTWAQARGFKQGHIWACPPQRGDNFIFWCHPPHQRTPSRGRLTAWYNAMLTRACRVGVVSEVSNLWEEYFSRYSCRDKDESQQRNAAKNSFVSMSFNASSSRWGNGSNGNISGSGRGSASDLNSLAKQGPSIGGESVPVCPPVFEGDYWITECLRIFRLVQQRLKGYDGQDRNFNLRRCRDALKHLMSRHMASPFSQAVDPVALNIPAYFSVIKTPMDLGTVRDRLRAGHYQNMLEFVQDVRLVFDNAMLFNPAAHAIHIMAKQLRNEFQTSMLEVMTEFVGTVVDASGMDHWLPKFPLGLEQVKPKFAAISRSSSAKPTSTASMTSLVTSAAVGAGSVVTSMAPSTALSLINPACTAPTAAASSSSDYIHGDLTLRGTTIQEIAAGLGSGSGMLGTRDSTSSLTNGLVERLTSGDSLEEDNIAGVTRQMSSRTNDEYDEYADIDQDGYCIGEDYDPSSFPRSRRLSSVGSVDDLPEIGRFWNSRSIYDSGTTGATGDGSPDSSDSSTAPTTGWDKPQLGFRGAMSMATDLAKSVLRLKDDLFVVKFADPSTLRQAIRVTKRGRKIEPIMSSTGAAPKPAPKQRGRRKAGAPPIAPAAAPPVVVPQTGGSSTKAFVEPSSSSGSSAQIADDDMPANFILNTDEIEFIPEVCLQLLDSLVPDTSDPDEDLHSPLVDSRHTFLEMCQYRHYQFDSLRRAKHSSMLLLHHLHNPQCSGLAPTCSHCGDIIKDVRWHCEMCPNLDYCDHCHSSNMSTSKHNHSTVHEHVLTPFRVTFVPF